MSGTPLFANLAVVQEIIAAAIPDREAFLWRDRRYTYAEINARCRRLARALIGMGLGCRKERRELGTWESGQDHVAVYAYNCNEFIEAMYGAYKARAAAVNINYRYVAEELRYVFLNSGAMAVVFQGAFAPQIEAIRGDLPNLRYFIQVKDDSGNPLLPGAVDYEELLAAHTAEPVDLPYATDDLYILYTGGTTGMPKGVLWRQEDVFYNGLGGHTPGLPRLETEEQLVEHVRMGLGGRFLVLPPFMHGTAQWSAFNTFHRGGTVVLPESTKRFDPHEAWAAVEKYRIESMMVVGDAFARPLLEALRERPYDASSLRMIGSTGAVLSPAVRDQLMTLLPQGVMFLESYGGSELGIQAMSYNTDSGRQGLPAYDLRPGSVVLAPDRSGVMDPATARKGEAGDVGWIASAGHLPLGYLGDAERTRRTFPVIGGVRYVVGGDRALYGEDGRLIALGRESVCINSGGEKIYAEEVERVVKSHPSVYDALAVGTPSERWGQQVTAVIALKPGCEAPTQAEMRAHCAPHLADYKIPKAVVVVPQIVRSPSGKPDYAWAAKLAEASLGAAPA